MSNVSIEGLDRLRTYLAGLGGVLDTRLGEMLDQRADSAVIDLAAATPVDTGAARLGWNKDAPDALTRIVSNPVQRLTGRNAPMSYPSVLITGSGTKGVPTTGYSFGYDLSWPHAMSPNQGLHDVWERLSNQPLTESQIGPLLGPDLP